MIRLLVLDMDDTLYLEREYVVSGLAAAATCIENSYDASRFLDSALAIFSRGIRTQIFNRALLDIGVADEPTLISEMLSRYREHLPSISLCPDAVLLFRKLPPAISTALVSDGYLPPQQRKVDALKLKPHFEKIILTESLGREFWKPHSKAFEILESHFKFTANQCVYVGDNPDKDFDGPKSLGWQTIRIQRPGALHERAPDKKNLKADRCIQSLEQLLPLLDD